MRDLNFDLKKMCDQNRHGSFGTQDQRRRELNLIANKLHELGYKGIAQASRLKPKHIHALVSHWRTEELSVSTIKNRMSALRWVAKQTNNAGLVKPTNDAYGIESRVFSKNEDRSLRFEEAKLSAITDPHVRFSAELQAAFGLRREEAMKFAPAYADKGNVIQLKASWTKGGKPREIPVRTPAQRDLLDRVGSFAKGGSLIPAHKSYVQHLKTFEKQMENAGLGRTHGARHLYAQERYKEITGWECPARGGPTSRGFSEQEKLLDLEARLTVSRELGHEREQITVVYLGR